MARFWLGLKAGYSAIYTFKDGRRTVLATADVDVPVLFELRAEDLNDGQLVIEPR